MHVLEDAVQARSVSWAIFHGITGNSIANSKAIFIKGICEFESCQVSQVVQSLRTDSDRSQVMPAKSELFGSWIVSGHGVFEPTFPDSGPKSLLDD